MRLSPTEERLRKLGERRRRNRAESDAIQKEISDAISKARGVLTVDRIAELLKMHRSSLYGQYGESTTTRQQGSGATRPNRRRRAPQR